MQAALDELDDATLDLVVALQLEDVAAIKQQDENGQRDSLGDSTVSQMFADELIQYREDRRSQDKDESSAEESTTNECAEQEKIECVSCEDHVLPEEAWAAQCSHHYCVDCLEILHRACLTDLTLYPPKCCDLEMPWDDVKPRLNHDLAATFEGKREELNTDAGNRTYCSDATCARFIGASHTQDDLATCPNCSKVTCTMCKAARHEGDCPADAALQQTLQLAEAHGWRRCTNCRSIVDLAQGCNHITCTCRHEFCYACGANWKTCECPNWDEQYIVAENDDDNPEAAAEGPDQHGVGRCEHELWTFVRGRGVCADCHWRSNLFTMVCNQCGLRACRRCMQNRLRDRVEVAEHRIEVAAQGVEVVEMPRREEPGEVMLRLLGQTRDFLADVFRW